MKTKQSKKLTEREIDEIVIREGDHNERWEKPIRVRRKLRREISISADLATRAEFLARLHRQPSAEDWIKRIIQERVELEEAAYAGMKRESVERT